MHIIKCLLLTGFSYQSFSKGNKKKSVTAFAMMSHDKKAAEHETAD